jgi:transposase
MPDDSTLALRRQVSRQSQLVGQRTTLKNEVHALLAAHLIERCPANDLFGRKGRAWLSAQPLSIDKRRGVSIACGTGPSSLAALPVRTALLPLFG